MSLGELEWREIPGYPYQIANDGTVLDGKTHEAVKPTKAKEGGYPKVFLRDHLGGTVHHYVHNLVARIFHGDPPGPGALVMHLDHDPTNNHVSNLRWGTHKTNAAGRLERGTVLRGEQLHNAVLAEATVLAIRRTYESGATTTEVAKQFGVSRQNVNNIVRGRSWRHVGGPLAPEKRRKRRGETLTEADAAAIILEAARGVPQSKIAARFGISQPAVSAIVTGKRWARLKRPG